MDMISFASHEADVRAEIAELKRAIAEKERENARILSRASKLQALRVRYETEIRSENDLVREIEHKCGNLEQQSTDLLKSKLQMKQMRQMNQDRLRDLANKRASKNAALASPTASAPPPSAHAAQAHARRSTNPLFSLRSVAAAAVTGHRHRHSHGADEELSRKMRELSELGTEFQAKEIRLHEKRLQNQSLRQQLLNDDDHHHDDEEDGSSSPLHNLEDSLD